MVGGGIMQLVSYGTQDMYLMDHNFDSELVNIVKNKSINDLVKILNNNTYTKDEIEDAIEYSKDIEIIVLLASHLNNPIMKNVMEIQRKKLIWKYTFNWLTKPITNDGLLGIDVRLGLKSLGELNSAPLNF